jgi:alkylated DNA repair protein alkB family protein 6
MCSLCAQVNAYAPGEGILPHQDGPLYHPAVAIVSLGASAVMHFTPHASLLDAAAAAGAAPPPCVRMWLPRRSLLLFADDAYATHLHGIPAVHADDVSGSGEGGGGVCNPPDGTADGDDAVGVVAREALRVSLTCRSVLKVRRNVLPVRP